MLVTRRISVQAAWVRLSPRVTNIKGMKKILTTHLFSLIFYAALVWPNKLTSSKSQKILEYLTTTNL